jgi:hypothetical protein
MRMILCTLILAGSAVADSVHVISTSPRLGEGAVAISPVNPQIVLAAAIGGRDFQDADVHVFRSTDGGRTWSPLGTVAKTLNGVEYSGVWDPVLAFDSLGRVYLGVVMGKGFDSWRIAVHRSDDNGSTWTATDIALPSAMRNDKPWIAIDGDGTIHAVWYQLATPGGMAYSFSRDRGVTFSTPELISVFGWPYVAAGPGRQVYLTYQAQFGAWEVIRSSDGGTSFSLPIRVADTAGSLPHQMIPGVRTGHVYAFVPMPDGVGFVRSIDGGTTWSSIRRMSSSSNGAWLPSIDVDRRTGEIVLAWYERVTDTQARIMATRSIDGGETFETPRFVSEPFVATRAAGEYNQLATWNSTHILVFGDGDGIFRAARLDSAPAPRPRPRRRAARP